MKNHNKQHNKQKGATLLIAIIFLLLITVVGVSSVNSTLIKTQVAGNSIYRMLVYQGAESTLARSVSNKDLSNLAGALLFRPNKYPVPATYIPNENVTSGEVLVSTSNITYEGMYGCPVTSARASSSLLKCQIFRVDAQSQLRSTNARDRHIKGVAIFSP